MAALAIGVAVAQLADFSFSETLLSVLLFGVLACLGLRRGVPWAGIAACLAAVFACGLMLGSRPATVDPQRVDRVWVDGRDEVDDPVRLRGWVRRPPEWVGYGDRFLLEVETLFADSPASGGVSITVYRDEDEAVLGLPYGTRVELLARPRRPRNFQNPGSFDYVGYLGSRGVFLTATARAGTPIHQFEGRGGTVWESCVWEARQAARARLERIAAGRDPNERVAGILGALLLGERTGLTQETRQDFRRTGAYHALVISGLHVGAIAFAVLSLLRLAMVGPVWRTLIGIVLVVGYALFAGAALPVMRAAWMCSAYLVSGLVYRQRRALNVIAGTAMVFLVIEPGLLFDASFQMSFLAVALIAGIGVPLLEGTLEPYRRALGDVWNADLDLHLDARVAEIRVALRMWLEPLQVVTRLPRWLVTGAVTGGLRVVIWAAALLVVSAVIQAGLALPMAAHFQRVSWGGIVANLCVMPLLLVMLPLGMVALITDSVWLGDLTWRCAERMSGAIEWFAAELPVDMRVPPPPLWLGVLFGASLVFVGWSFGRAWHWRAAAWPVFAACLAMVVVHPFPARMTPGELELTAIDVGQGESLFLALPGGGTMLVDGGGLPDYGGTRTQTLDIGDAVVSPYLWSRSVRRLDVLAITHTDADHFGGVPAVLENFDVGEVWLARMALEEEGKEWVEGLQARGTPVRFLKRGDRVQVGEVAFDVLSPPEGMAVLGDNDRSLVLTASFGEHSFLLTGDIEARAEALLVNTGELPKAAVLKVAHHGSRTSTMPNFLEKVKPTFAVVSAGFRNSFGHPHPFVLARLRERGVRILRTDVEGLVTVATDGRRLRVETFRGEQAATGR